MGKMKEIFIIEETIFNVLETLHHNMKIKNQAQYKLGLEVLEELNDEYLELTGQYYIDQDRILQYYEKNWSEFHA